MRQKHLYFTAVVRTWRQILLTLFLVVVTAYTVDCNEVPMWLVNLFRGLWVFYTALILENNYQKVKKEYYKCG